MKKSILSIAQLLCCIAMLTACAKEDNTKAPSPQDNWTAEEKQFASEVIGVWTDFDENQQYLAPAYVIYDIQEDGDFEIYTMTEDGKNVSVDEISCYEQNEVKGTWRPVVNVKDRWEVGKPINGVEVTVSQKATEDQTAETVRDTLLFIQTGNDESIKIWTSDLDYAYAYYNALTPEQLAEYGYEEPAGIARRGILGWIAQRFINTGKFIANIAKMVAQPVKMIIRKIEGKNAKYASDMSDWMAKNYAGRDPKICEMSIPGTHDTFTYSMSWYGLIPTMQRKVTTQFLDIPSQWDAGIRSYDVRLGKHKKGLGMCHGPFYLGVTFDEGMEMFAKQLRVHKGETAIIILKFEETVGEEQYKMVYDKIEAYRKEGLVVNDPTPGMKLSQCKGKMIFIQRYDSNKYNLDIRATGWDENSELIFKNDNSKKTKLYVQDLYESNGKELIGAFIKRKESKMKETFEKAAASTDDTWFFNHESCYHGVDIIVENSKLLDMNYAETAHTLNPWAADYVKDHYGKKTGVVVMDFGGIDECSYGLYFTRGIDLPTYLVENNTKLTIK